MTGAKGPSNEFRGSNGSPKEAIALKRQFEFLKEVAVGGRKPTMYLMMDAISTKKGAKK